MKTKQVIDKLKEFNAWRRGAEIPMPNPTEIGVTIDRAVKLLEWMLNRSKIKGK